MNLPLLTDFRLFACLLSLLALVYFLRINRRGRCATSMESLGGDWLDGVTLFVVGVYCYYMLCISVACSVRLVSAKHE